MQLFITKAGAEAERQALADGRDIHITHVVVDSKLLAASANPADLTEVQVNPTDQDGNLAKYPLAGESVNGKVLLAWKLPAESGGYDVKGLGFTLSDGTLWAYQRAELGYKPHPDNDAVFEPRGTITHITSAAEHITVELSLDTFGASMNDVQHLLRQQELNLKQLMRKVEGKLGQVRTYLKETDLDDGFIPVRGQMLRKSDYPEYFAHVGVTAETLNLPDWVSYPYLAQASNAGQAGAFLNQSIQSHAHTAVIHDGGSYTPQAYPIDIGSKTGNLTLNGRFTTHLSGHHNHSGSTHNAGAHSHHRGSMEISGQFGVDDWVRDRKAYNGAYAIEGGWSYDAKSGGGGGAMLGFKASRSWTGRTEHAGEHSHGLAINGSGDHSHYVDVNFGQRAVSINIGSYTPRLKTIPDHKHGVTVNATGGSFTRPNTALVIFAVKVKYTVDL